MEIVSIHVGPYDANGVSYTSQFATAFDELGIDLVLFGHNHAFLRSNPIKGGVVGEPGSEGTVYYSSGSATNGYGTPKPEGLKYFEVGANLGESSYGAITITDNSLTIESLTVPKKPAVEGKLVDTIYYKGATG